MESICKAIQSGNEESVITALLHFNETVSSHASKDEHQITVCLSKLFGRHSHMMVTIVNGPSTMTVTVIIRQAIQCRQPTQRNTCVHILSHSFLYTEQS